MSNNLNEVESFEECLVVAKKATAKLLSKARRAGNPVLDKETIFSDVCMTYVKCRDNYDSNFGVPFKAYFYMAAMKNYGMFVRDAYDEVSANSSSIDATIGEDEGSRHDFDENMIDHSIDTEALVSQRQRIRRMAGKFPILVSMLEIIISAPDDLMAELEACKAHEALSEKLGYNVDKIPQVLTFDVLTKMFGFNWRQSAKLSKEIEDAAAYIS